MTIDIIYRIPAGRHRIEIEVINSRFLATVERASTVEAAHALLADIRAEMSTANHHVYAYRVGYGKSVIEGMSDDGEPSGTAGPPTLAVLRGTNLGDTLVVVTRYFGGTKLGTGGLVRAYSEATREALATAPTELKIEKRTLGIETPYNIYEVIRRAIGEYEGTVIDETFAGEVTILATFPLSKIGPFSARVRDLSAGRVEPVELG